MTYCVVSGTVTPFLGADLNGQIKIGKVERNIRVEDVAREAGVSPITVSRTLSAPHKVRPETRERVMDAVVRTGYVINSIASSLRSGRSSFVAVFVVNLQSPHFASAIHGALDAFEASRYHLIFSQVGYDERAHVEAIESVLPLRPAAVIVTGVVQRDATRAMLRTLGVPIVEMWGDRPDPVDMLVCSPGFSGGRLIGEHFARRGFRRVAYAGQIGERGNMRLEGFSAGLAEHGRRCDLVVPAESSLSFTEAMNVFSEVLTRLPDVDAIFCGTDVLAMGVSIVARRRGMAVPQDIAIAGYGDLDFAAHIDPPLTSIRVSDYELGRLAGGMVLRRLEGVRDDPPIVRVPVTLIERESTRRAATG